MSAVPGRKAHVPRRESLEYAWPERLSARDPWAGDEVLAQPGSYVNYKHFAPHSFAAPLLNEQEYLAAEADFHEVYRAILEGRAPWPDIEPVALRTGVLLPIRYDKRPLLPVPFELPDDALADYVSDWVPDIGITAPERVFGPWAEGALPMRWRCLAAAVLAYAPLIPPDMSAIARACRSRPRPPRVLRMAMRGAGHAPPMLWRIEGDRVHPMLPMARRCRPPGPVRRLPDAPFALGRCLPGPDGWFMSGALPMLEAPPIAGLSRRIKLELLKIRLEERRSTWEDALRASPGPLYRTTAMWLWRRDGAAGDFSAQGPITLPGAQV